MFITHTTHTHTITDHRIPDVSLFLCPAWKICVCRHEDAKKTTEELNADYVASFFSLAIFFP